MDDDDDFLAELEAMVNGPEVDDDDTEVGRSPPTPSLTSTNRCRRAP